MSKKTILFIDDDRAILKTVGDRLMIEGYAVVTATSGEEGLAKLRQTHPDLILLDISMPGMGGIKFLNDITKPDGCTLHPVIVFTARASMEEFFTSLAVDGFVAKSEKVEKLLGEIERVLGKGRLVEDISGPAPMGHVPLVLHGDEDRVYAQVVLDFLENAGFNVIQAQNGPRVVEIALTKRPDFILMNMILPDMNGNVVAKILKDVLGNALMPVILYDDSGLHPRDSIFPGVATFLTSDMPEDLVDTIQSIINKRAQTDFAE